MQLNATMKDKLQGGTYVRVSWILWLIVVMLAVTYKLVALREPHGGTQRFWAFMVYALVTWIPIMVVNWIQGWRVWAYLAKQHYERWKSISGLPFAKGVTVAIGALSFMITSEDFGDPVISAFKAHYSRFLRLVFAVFVSMPVMFIFFMEG